jgi:hypothetical protein
MCHQKVPRPIFQSLQGSIQGGKSVLPHGNSGLCIGRFSLSMGQRREICILLGCSRSRTQAFPTIQNDSVDHKKYLREDNGGGQYNCVGRSR